MTLRSAVTLAALSVVAATVGATVFFGKADHQGARRAEDILRFHRYGQRMSTTVFDFIESKNASDSYSVTSVPPAFFDETVTVRLNVSEGPHVGEYTFVVHLASKGVKAADAPTERIETLTREWAREKESPPHQGQ